MNKHILSILAILIVGLLLMSCSNNNSQSKKTYTDQTQAVKPTTSPTTQSAGELPQFTAKDIDGNSRNSDTWVGKQPVVINFWGTWCPPCRREIPDLVKLYDEYHDKGIEIVGLAVKDTPEKVRAFSEKNGMKWVMLLSDYNVASKFRISSVPTTIFVDRNGKIVQRFSGLRSYNTFKQAFESIL